MELKRISQNKIKEDFYNLWNAFSKKDADKYRHLSELEIEEIKKKFDKLEKSLSFKRLRNNINTIHYEDLNSDKELNLEELMKINIEKLEVLEDYLKSLIEIIVNQK